MRHLVLALGVLGLLACGARSSTPDARVLDDGGVVLPDFALLDVNPASPTAGRQVSPRDFRGKVSAWYFGHSS